MWRCVTTGHWTGRLVGSLNGSHFRQRLHCCSSAARSSRQGNCAAGSGAFGFGPCRLWDRLCCSCRRCLWCLPAPLLRRACCHMYRRGSWEAARGAMPCHAPWRPEPPGGPDRLPCPVPWRPDRGPRCRWGALDATGDGSSCHYSLVGSCSSCCSSCSRTLRACIGLFIVRVQPASVCKATASHRLPALTGHWTRWTLDTLIKPQWLRRQVQVPFATALCKRCRVQADGCRLLVQADGCKLQGSTKRERERERERSGRASGRQRKTRGRCPVGVAHSDFHTDTPSTISAPEDTRQLYHVLVCECIQPKKLITHHISPPPPL